jgi:hypothetical protein
MAIENFKANGIISRATLPQLCRRVAIGLDCVYGDGCKFSHDIEVRPSIRPTPPLPFHLRDCLNPHTTLVKRDRSHVTHSSPPPLGSQGYLVTARALPEPGGGGLTCPKATAAGGRPETCPHGANCRFAACREHWAAAILGRRAPAAPAGDEDAAAAAAAAAAAVPADGASSLIGKGSVKRCASAPHKSPPPASRRTRPDHARPAPPRPGAGCPPTLTRPPVPPARTLPRLPCSTHPAPPRQATHRSGS